MQDKPNASLSNQDVCEIIQELDNLIKLEAEIQKPLHLTDVNFGRSIAKEVAYMKARNLILSKI